MSHLHGPAGNPPGNPSDGAEDPRFWRRIIGAEVVARAGDISAAAIVDGEDHAGDPVLRVTGATRHVYRRCRHGREERCVDIEVTPEIRAALLPALVEAAREAAEEAR